MEAEEITRLEKLRDSKRSEERIKNTQNEN
jgi:hypothetical protein